jgi:hypothetical protein
VRKPEDGGDMFFETLILTTATKYRVPEFIYKRILTYSAVYRDM